MSLLDNTNLTTSTNFIPECQYPGVILGGDVPNVDRGLIEADPLTVTQDDLADDDDVAVQQGRC